MANVKISDLPIGIPNSTSIFPFVDSGTTYQGAISAITSNGGSVTETTYSELQDMVNGGGLTTGSYYIITDFRTCYDQPDYDETGNPITEGIYKQASVDPIIVFATSANTLSTEAFQPSYPKDRIQYDVYFSQTEITSGDSYGRITERIDEYNNRTDYDHRTILFKRYTTYFYDMGEPNPGTIEILDSNGSVTGTSTNFTDLGIGNVIKIKNGLNYKVVNVVSDTEMYITGTTINTGSNLIYYLTYAESDNDGSGYPKSYDYKYNNIIDTESRELPTFRFDWELENNGQVKSINNYIGNHSNFWYTNLSHSYFLLANNTFSMYSYSNTLGDRCYNNASYTWFNRNEIAGSFYNNAMWRGFYANIVGEYCNNNIFGGYTWRNKLGEDFYENQTFSDFQNNIINNGFNNNIITSDFYKNDIGNGFNHNNVYWDFYGNEIGNGFNGNNLYCEFYENIVGEYYEDNMVGIIDEPYSVAFSSNRIGDSFYNNTITSDFYKNQTGVSFTNNDISGQTTNNVINNTFENNTILGTFINNKIGNEFKGNLMVTDFELNDVSTYVASNQFSGSTYQNKIGPYTFYNDFLGYMVNNSWGTSFYENTIDSDFNNNNFGNNIHDNNIGYGFQYNQIGSDFYNNTIDDNFGYGASTSQGNKIGNYFRDNEIGEYFYNNTIPDNFHDNVIGNYFQWNIFNTNVDNVDFTLNYGNITGFSYTANGTTATDGLYTEVEGSTTGSGFNSLFNIEVSGNQVIGVSGFTSNNGQSYQINDVITILGSDIGGTTPDDDVVITVTGISEDSLFYQHYTKQIFERKGGDKRVSYYDETDILNIDSVYLASGYITIYSQSLTFPITYASFDFHCDGGYVLNGGTTSQSATTADELVTLFNNQLSSFGKFFNNNDGTIGMYIDPGTKEGFCPNGVFTLNVYSD
jgi:hypothetical protein